MTYDELLAKIDKLKANASKDVWVICNDRCCGDCTCDKEEQIVISPHNALRAVVELHKPQQVTILSEPKCRECFDSEWADYPCSTIRAIEKELAQWVM